MPLVSVDIPSTQANRIAAAFIALYPPPANVPVGTSAQKLAYVKSLFVRHVKEVVCSYEAQQAAATATQTAVTKADAEITPT